ncbi:MAG: hypothetical protein GXX92_11480 [Clostridiales bacterium]|nr:hypothetical protein [Clostridiales bacterium]
MAQNRNDRFASVQLGLMAELLSILAEEQTEASQRMEKQTNKLIHLTWALTALTFLLLIITIVLACKT